MSFSIRIVNYIPRLTKNIPYYKGEIVIGDFSESFYVMVKYWTLKDYEHQWQEAIDQIQKNSISCLVTAIAGPKWPGAMLWPMYREGDMVYIQNHMYSSKTYRRLVGRVPFTTQNCYQFIKPHKRFTPEGDQISEWEVPLSDLLVWQKASGPRLNP